MLRVLPHAGAELVDQLLGVKFLGIDRDPIVQIAGLRALQPYPFARHGGFPYKVL